MKFYSFQEYFENRFKVRPSCPCKQRKIYRNQTIQTSGSLSDQLTIFREALSNCLISEAVSLILLFEDAPKSIDSIFGRLHTYSIASRGETAPPASTCMAMARNCLVLRICSYFSFPPDILKPALLIDEQIIGFLIPAPSSTSKSMGRFIVI